MPVLSSIATHPQKQRIIDAIVAGQPFRIITSWTVPTVSPAALSRFKRKSMESIRRNPIAQRAMDIYNDAESLGARAEVATRAAMDGVASPFRARIESIWQRTERTLDRAETAVRVVPDGDGELVPIGQDLAVMAPLLAQAHRSAELLGRATGELDNSQAAGTNVNILLNIPR